MVVDDVIVGGNFYLFLLKVYFQYCDARRQKQGYMTPLLQGAEPCDSVRRLYLALILCVVIISHVV